MDRLQGTPTPLGGDPPQGLGRRDQNDQCPEEGPRQRLQGTNRLVYEARLLHNHYRIQNCCCVFVVTYLSAGTAPTARVARLFNALYQTIDHLKRHSARTPAFGRTTSTLSGASSWTAAQPFSNLFRSEER